MDAFSYSRFRDLLNRASAEVTPAEVQGLQFGLLCGSSNFVLEKAHTTVIRELFPSTPPSASLTQLLHHSFSLLVNEVQSHATEITFELPLLLPEEDAPFVERLQALCSWCQGFLYGLALSGQSLQQIRSPEAKEAFADILEIAKLPPAPADEASDLEEAEEQLMAVMDYVPVAAMVLFTELYHPTHTEVPTHWH